MRILFLDFDGVLITWRSHFARKDMSTKAWEHPDPVCANFLRNVIEMSTIPMHIVVSSSWRKGEIDTMNLLTKCNLIDKLHTDWATTTRWPQDGVPARGWQIAEWVKAHPDIIDYRILDDDSDMLPHQFDRFVKCDGWDGLGGREMKTLMDWAKS